MGKYDALYDEAPAEKAPVSKYAALHDDAPAGDAPSFTRSAPARRAPSGYEAAFAAVNAPEGTKLATPAEGPSVGRSFALGAEQGATFGLAPAIKAGVETAVSHIPLIRDLAQKIQPGDLPAVNDPNLGYDARRQFYAGELEQSRNTNPIATGAGELAGGAVTALVAPELAPLKGAGTAAKVGNAAINAGLQGAAAGAGEAISQGGSAGDVATSAGIGAGAGALLGAGLQAVGSRLASRSQDRFLSDVAADVRGRPKDQKLVRRALESDEAPAVQTVHRPPREGSARHLAETEMGPIDDIAAPISGKDVVFNRENKGIVTAIRKGDYNAARDRIEARLQTLKGEDDHAYLRDYRIVEAKAGKLDKAAVLASLDGQIGALAQDTGTQAKRHVLSAIRDDIDSVYGDEIPVLKFRKSVSTAQKSAVKALGTIAETEHAELRETAEHAVESILAQHLDAAAHVDAVGAQAVQSIRNRNKEISTLLAIDKSLETRQLKAQNQTKSLKESLQGLAGHGLHGSAPILAFMGHPAAAAAAFALPTATKLGARAATAGNDALARLAYAAQHGSSAAQRTLDAAAKSPRLAAQIAGRVAAPDGQTE